MKKTLRRLDYNRDYGTVYGLSGVNFTQDNLYFNSVGEQVFPEEETAEINENEDSEETESPENEAPVIKKSRKPRKKPAARKTKSPRAVKPAKAKMRKTETKSENAPVSAQYDAMPDSELKASVETFGGVWYDRKRAIAFLTGQEAA